MSEKKLLSEELSEVVGGAEMSTAQFVSACSTLSDAQLQLLISSMDKPQLLKLLKSVNDPALTERLKGPLIASGNESLVAIVIKDTTNQA